MSEPFVCPDLQKLQQFLALVLPSEEAAKLEEHLRSCAVCTKNIQQLDVLSTIVDVIRSAPANEEPETDLLQDLIKQLQKWPNGNFLLHDGKLLPSAEEPTEVPHPMSVENPAGVGTPNSSRYTRRRLFAEGGLGRVWLAWDNELNRAVALKEIQPALADDTKVVERFLKEAHVTGQLEHPHIVPVYELNRDSNGRPFYTMRLVQGRTLHDSIKEYHKNRGRKTSDRFQLSRLLNVFVSVCNAVAYGHSRGVVHRDLKPRNVVLGEFGEVFVLDWGLVKLVEDAEQRDHGPSSQVSVPVETTATLAGSRMGTPAYMAPEQAAGRGDLSDARTDIHGLGAILFEVLCDQPPYRGKTRQKIYEQILQGETPHPRALDSTVPATLNAICLKAMAKEPSARYSVAGDLADDVQRWLADEPVAAYREPLLARVARWGRRHPTIVVSTLVALLMVAAVFLVLDFYVAQRQNTLALNQAKTLLQAKPHAVPILIEGIHRFPRHSLPWLRNKSKDNGLTTGERIRISLALLKDDPDQVDYLQDQLLEASPGEVNLILHYLTSHQEKIKTRFWLLTENRQLSPEKRLRVACVLATFDSDNSRWAWIGPQVATILVHEDLALLGDWIDTLRPVQSQLVAAVEKIYYDPSASESAQLAAAIVLAAYGKSIPDRQANKD